MSIKDGFFTNSDGEEFRVRDVVVVEEVVAAAGKPYYEVIFSGGHHVSIREDYFSRASFLSAWRAA